MSGDVQPRKRKDKKRKKDELGVEEPRGTAAVLGEGDVFMHSQHEHGTGGHWCAKIIFFSLLAVLVTLIGLIILENRGLTELEANSVESRYSGVLEGWLEDAPDDDHHDEHTLELLKQHDDDDDHDQEHEVSQEDEHDQHDDNDDEDEPSEVDHDEENDNDSGHDNDDDEQDASDEDDEQEPSNEEQDEHDENDNNDDSAQEQEDENSEEQHIEEADEDDDDDDRTYGNNESDENNDDDDDLQKFDENDTAEADDDNDLLDDQADNQSAENDEDANSDENDEEHEEQEEEEGDSEIEVEKLEKEVSDEDVLSEEQPNQQSEEEQDDNSQEVSAEAPLAEVDDAADEADSVEDEEFLEPEDVDDPLPVVERIVAPKGKPLTEVEDEPTTEKPADTLADEEEYEKQQEALRQEEAQASHVWLKLAVGGALLVATHAVVSRAVAPRDDSPASDGHTSREDTPSTIDRRMTLIPEDSAAAAPPTVEEIIRPVVEEKVVEKVASIIKSTREPPKEESEEEDVEEEEEVIIGTKAVAAAQPAVEVETEDKELYSDEDEAEEVEEEEEEEIVEQKKETPKQAAPALAKPPATEPEAEEPEAEEDVSDDVEIIDEEQLEEELEEEEDEEEISDVDDAELLSRLEAKYGRLPEPHRPEPKHKDGGNSIEADWPGEPSDKYWRQQLDEAEQELRQGDWSAASARVSAEQLKESARARWILARAIDASAEAKRDNRLLTRAITTYLDVLKMNERLSDARLREIADRTLDRIRFRGNYLSAEPVYRLLIRRFPDVVHYRNNMTVSLLMANRADLAEEVIKETLKKWPDDRVALAHHGFILETQHHKLEEAVEAFQKALEGDVGPATEPRFYYHWGDSLILLGRFEEAHEVHKRGAKLGHFLSPVQRSLYNVDRLKSRPWWDLDQTPYRKLARALEKSWKEILKEGQAAQALYEKEKEGLKERGEWSQLDLFVRGQEVPGRCKKAPVTCSIVRTETAAVGCRRGQIKFSSMEAGTHVRPHVGPTNCRLRMHLGLSNTKDTYIRVDQETRQWQVGKVLMFDDSFEHEVWHNGTGTRLVLIVDVWHPDLTPAERRSLPAI